MTTIEGTSALDRFRQNNPGEHVLARALSTGEITLIDWAIGVGKSTCLDQIIDTVIRKNSHDLVVVLAPLRRLIDERQLIRDPLPNVDIINLRPRPTDLCGRVNDRDWAPLEKNNMGLLGRVEICGRCPNQSNCYWPGQFKLKGKSCQVIFGTQAYLNQNPFLLSILKTLTGTSNVLFLLDEINFTLINYRQTITVDHLNLFFKALEEVIKKDYSKNIQKWIHLCQLLAQAPSSDIRSGSWSTPAISKQQLLSVLQTGYKKFNINFKNLHFQINHFCRSPINSREKLDSTISFAITPFLDGKSIVFSGSAVPEFLSYRLNQSVQAPYQDYRFNHPDTVWLNIASLIGAKKYFQRNSPQVLDFFTQLIIQRFRSGRRCLLITKKCFIGLCIKGLQQLFIEEGYPHLKILVDDFTPEILGESETVPIITYGMVGTNLFQEYDCAFCLNSYYTSEEAINSVLQDFLPSDFNIPLQITTQGNPLRRSIGVKHPEHQFVDINRLSNYALQQQEMEVVLQAVGRVRPFTKSREIITFQCGAVDKISYDHEFQSLTEARKYFGVLNKRERQVKDTTFKINQAKSEGLSQSKTASKLGLSIRTVKRYWNNNLHTGVTKPYNYINKVS